MRKKVLRDGGRETQPDVVDHEWNPRSARLSSIRRVLVLHQVTRHFRDQPGEEFVGVQGAEQGQPFVVLDALHAPAGSAARGRAVRARNAGHPAGRTHAPNRTGRVSSGGGGEASKSNSGRASIRFSSSQGGGLKTRKDYKKRLFEDMVRSRRRAPRSLGRELCH